MEIGDVFKLRERIEFFPGKCLRIFHQSADFQAPIFQRDFRFDAEIENREPLGEMLAWRKAFSRASEPDWRISGPDCRFFFGRHFARPTFLALDQAWVRRRHEGNFNRDFRWIEQSLARCHTIWRQSRSYFSIARRSGRSTFEIQRQRSRYISAQGKVVLVFLENRERITGNETRQRFSDPLPARFELLDGVAQFGGPLVKLLRNCAFHLALHDLEFAKRPLRAHFRKPFFQKRDLAAFRRKLRKSRLLEKLYDD